jgi:hypothetical protein
MSRKIGVTLMPLVLTLAAVAGAHHSIAAFDRDHPATLEGTVRQFKYTNPHTWLSLLVADGNGGERQWDLEGGSVNMAAMLGVTRNTFRHGQKVKLLIAPRKDGADGGEWLRPLEIDGKAFVAPAAKVPEVTPRSPTYKDLIRK